MFDELLCYCSCLHIAYFLIDEYGTLTDGDLDKC